MFSQNVYNEENKQNVAVGQQQNGMSSQSPVPDRRILLIRSVKKYPSLYKTDFHHVRSMKRRERQRLWDIVADESGFKKTEDAKAKWSYLIANLRQHMKMVAQKKQRRYIPKTGNTEDQYIQLRDWPFYTEMEFILPYLKIATSKLNASRKTLTNCISTKGHNEQNDYNMPHSIDAVKWKESSTGDHDKHDDTTEAIELTEEEEILKEFFDIMFKSTLKLPRFHQQRVKNKLMHAIEEEKGK